MKQLACLRVGKRTERVVKKETDEGEKGRGERQVGVPLPFCNNEKLTVHSTGNRNMKRNTVSS